MIVDLKTSSEEAALISFSERTNIQELSNFVNILLGSMEGDDVSTAIKLTEREMEVIRREEKNRKILALPDKSQNGYSCNRSDGCNSSRNTNYYGYSKRYINV